MQKTDAKITIEKAKEKSNIAKIVTTTVQCLIVMASVWSIVIGLTTYHNINPSADSIRAKTELMKAQSELAEQEKYQENERKIALIRSFDEFKECATYRQQALEDAINEFKTWNRNAVDQINEWNQ